MARQMIHRISVLSRRRPRAVTFVGLGLVLVLCGGVLVGLGAFPRGSGPSDATDLTAAGAVASPSRSAAPAGSVLLPSSVASPVAAATSSPPQASVGTQPSPVTPSSAPPVAQLDPAPAPGPFTMDLYRTGQFVTELSKVMCVPAAMQTMINIMAGTADRSTATQNRLYSLARTLSPKTLNGPGAEPEGWAAGLAKLGYGSYAVTISPTLAAAVQAAARSIRMTGKPAGLLVWYGAHSWVMSGFRATADPAWTDQFTVTDLYIEDVWYPKISSIWGASRPPDALVPIRRLPRDFLPWRMPGGPYPDKAWKFVTVLPTISK